MGILLCALVVLHTLCQYMIMIDGCVLLLLGLSEFICWLIFVSLLYSCVHVHGVFEGPTT